MRALRRGAFALPVALLCAGAACSGPLSPGDLWDRPAQSDVRDAHATIMGTGRGFTFSGDGLVVFRPRLAMSLHLQTLTGALPAELDVLQVGGSTYQRSGADQQWTRSTTSPPDPTWQNATDPRLLGQDRLGGVQSWHLRASRGRNPVDMWVRQRDGYPLRLVTTDAVGATFTFVFTRFNSGDRIAAPPPLRVQPGPHSLRGSVGDVLTLGAARITVLGVDEDASAGDGGVMPGTGNRFVAVDVLVEDVGQDWLTTFFDWRLTDARGVVWDQPLPVLQPSFVGGELAPGDSSRGYLTFEVTRSATGLALTVRVDDNIAVFALG